jgi:hypothetical protein
MPTYDDDATSRSRVSRRVELSSALVALLLALPVAALLLVSGALRLDRSDAFALFVAVFLGPLVGLTGAFFDARRGQPLGLLLLALAALLAFDGAVNTGLLGLPAFLLILASLIAGIVARRQQARSGAAQG